MEETGMTDLQFKSFLRQLIRNIEEAKEKDEKEAISTKLDEILKDLKEDLQN